MEIISQDIHEKTCRERLQWLVNLRWIAILMVFSVVSISITLFQIPLPALPLYIGVLILTLYNTLFRVIIRRMRNFSDPADRHKTAQILANLQISMDLIMLGYFIHFSGGLENPFIFYFIFHMVISSILLTPKAAYLQAALALFLLGSVGFLEWTNLIPHYHLA